MRSKQEHRRPQNIVFSAQARQPNTQAQQKPATRHTDDVKPTPEGQPLKDLEGLEKGKTENHQPLRLAGQAPLWSDQGFPAQGQSPPQGSPVQGRTGLP